MSDKLILGLFLVAIVLITVVLTIVKKGRMPVKYAMVWLLPAMTILLLALFPGVFRYAANVLGFVAISSLVTGILILILFFIILALTVLLAGMNKKVILLIQEISILKKKMEDYEEDIK